MTLYQRAGSSFDPRRRAVRRAAPIVVFGGVCTAPEPRTGPRGAFPASWRVIAELRVHPAQPRRHGRTALQFLPGDSVDSLGIKGDETFDITKSSTSAADAGDSRS